MLPDIGEELSDLGWQRGQIAVAQVHSLHAAQGCQVTFAQSRHQTLGQAGATAMGSEGKIRLQIKQ